MTDNIRQIANTFEYFLNLEELKVKKHYKYTELNFPFDSKKYLDYPLVEGLAHLEREIGEPLRNIKNSGELNKEPVLIKILTNDEVDTFIAHAIINKIVDVLTEGKEQTYRDWLVVPRPIEKNVVGTVKSIIQLVNTEPAVPGLQIKIFNAQGDGINFIEKLEG